MLILKDEALHAWLYFVAMEVRERKGKWILILCKWDQVFYMNTLIFLSFPLLPVKPNTALVFPFFKDR